MDFKGTQIYRLAQLEEIVLQINIITHYIKVCHLLALSFSIKKQWIIYSELYRLHIICLIKIRVNKCKVELFSHEVGIYLSRCFTWIVISCRVDAFNHLYLYIVIFVRIKVPLERVVLFRHAYIIYQPVPLDLCFVGIVKAFNPASIKWYGFFSLVSGLCSIPICSIKVLYLIHYISCNGWVKRSSQPECEVKAQWPWLERPCRIQIHDKVHCCDCVVRSLSQHLDPQDRICK